MSLINEFDAWFHKRHYEEYLKFWNEFNKENLERKKKKCSDCAGEGTITYENSDHTHNIDCTRCDGTGFIDE